MPSDIRGIMIERGDFVSIATPRTGFKGAVHDFCIVEDVKYLDNTITLDDGDILDLSATIEVAGVNVPLYEVLILPDDYKEW